MQPQGHRKQFLHLLGRSWPSLHVAHFSLTFVHSRGRNVQPVRIQNSCYLPCCYVGVVLGVVLQIGLLVVACPWKGPLLGACVWSRSIGTSWLAMDWGAFDELKVGPLMLVWF